ncbi:MAG: transcription antitermination factor NusB [Desulfomonile tiedjei]|uniref:Transcription antitermination protein NusB n=1 Tax=Desulfomonile tiedjei TaxID=2358 RepID=A0A9D6UZJ6_9BACT|nr:transcription antitermination factor NusB [Desulfomonile tiedjei]
MPSRRKTREFVLQVLFAADARQQDPLEALEFLESHFHGDDDEELKLHRVMKDFARQLVAAVSKDQAIIDGLISKLSHNWKLYRINRVDRNILRMAIAEMTSFPEIPGRVVLNEAIEIGKKYGAENSAAFINGILDRIHMLEPRPRSTEELQKSLTELDQNSSTD